MLAQLAARLRGRAATTDEGGEGGEEDVPIVLDDNCNVSLEDFQGRIVMADRLQVM